MKIVKIICLQFFFQESIYIDFGISATELKRLCNGIEVASEPPSKKPRKDTLKKVPVIERPSNPQPGPSRIRSENLKKSLVSFLNRKITLKFSFSRNL